MNQYLYQSFKYLLTKKALLTVRLINLLTIFYVIIVSPPEQNLLTDVPHTLDVVFRLVLC